MNTILSDATSHELEAAIAQNHCDLFLLDARTKNGIIRTEEGLCWTYINEEGSGNILFPALSANTAKLNEMIAFYHIHPSKNIGCWSLDPPETRDLDVLLLARGFQPGWRPCWMSLHLHAITADHTSPEGLNIVADNETPLDTVTDLPYAGNDSSGSGSLQYENPDQIRRFVAKLNGNIVAQTLLLFGGGVAGIYNVGVVPEARGQGVGKAIVRAACLYAREKGYHYATLNANHIGRPIYEQLGFKRINDGLTWWITDDRLNTRPPDHKEVAIAEATGKGDIVALSAFSDADLNKSLCNGMRLIQLAAHCRQTEAAEWLIAHGAICEVMDAWDLGWKDRAKAILLKKPGEVNRLHGDHQYTLLHVAVERNDIELAQVILSASPNLQIKDSTHEGTALDWAHYLHRNEIGYMIKAHTSV